MGWPNQTLTFSDINVDMQLSTIYTAVRGGRVYKILEFQKHEFGTALYTRPCERICKTDGDVCMVFGVDLDDY